MPKIIQIDALPQPSLRKPIQEARQSLNRRTAHIVPSTLTLQMRQQILGELRAGRSVHQVAKAYNASAFVPMEIWTRAIENELRGLRRAA